jgi:hypothetical protein
MAPLLPLSLKEILKMIFKKKLLKNSLGLFSFGPEK